MKTVKNALNYVRKHTKNTRIYTKIHGKYTNNKKRKKNKNNSKENSGTRTLQTCFFVVLTPRPSGQSRAVFSISNVQEISPAACAGAGHCGDEVWIHSWDGDAVAIWGYHWQWLTGTAACWMEGVVVPSNSSGLGHCADGVKGQSSQPNVLSCPAQCERTRVRDATKGARLTGPAHCTPGSQVCPDQVQPCSHCTRGELHHNCAGADIMC